jgi:RsiW-degrading membrane proteinase PrsW (M82 family)
MFFPLAFLGTVLGIVLAFMARRKGRNPFLWFVIGLIPFVGVFAALVLASRPDSSLLNRLWALEDRLAKAAPDSHPPQPPSNERQA